MPDLSKLRALSLRDRAVVIIGVLLDGHDAHDFLSSDKEKSAALSKAAADLAQLPIDLRMPLLGTLLRDALIKLGQ